MEEYLQVVLFEIKIIKQDFEKRNLELENKIEQLGEEKNALEIRCRWSKARNREIKKREE
ncbi:hypothetical protein Goshw_021641 [Gossypium schwendimanii]|uniref:Uncharacterized protein n=1 Tax=Gossypium schwendimanii TaxID=34291 RepID=A0A7J9LXE9_GOSSC|nr:hypothetical protein [Gossypium schwendimanii]